MERLIESADSQSEELGLQGMSIKLSTVVYEEELGSA